MSADRPLFVQAATHSVAAFRVYTAHKLAGDLAASVEHAAQGSRNQRAALNAVALAVRAVERLLLIILRDSLKSPPDE